MTNKFLLFFILFPVLFFSQEKFEFTGMLRLNGSDESVISYKLLFTLTNNVISGYSITDVGGAHETKNTIIGTYDKKSKLFSFQEKQILYTKSVVTKFDFCYVFYTSQVKLASDLKKIDGNFTSKYKDGKSCINGTLLLVNSKRIEKITKKYNNKIQKSKKVDDATKKEVNLVRILDSVNTNNLIKNQNMNVFAGSSKIKIEIWDSKKVDGDAVNIYLNNKLILKDYAATAKKKVIEIDIKSETEVLKIEATNEGEIKPNTVMIKIIDGVHNYDLISNLKKWDFATITFLKSN